METEESDILWTIRKAGVGLEGERRAALVEVLVSSILEKNPGKEFPSPTEYYVGALATLATHLTNHDHSHEHLSADLLYILSKIVPHVPVGVLRLDSDATLASVLSATNKSSNQGARSGLRVLGGILRAQSKDAWIRPIVLKCFKACLSRLIDDNPKVRKSAQESVIDILSKPHSKSSPTSPSSLCVDFIKNSLNSSEPRKIFRLLHFCRPVSSILSSNTKLIHELAILVTALVEKSVQQDLSQQALITLIVISNSLADEDTEIRKTLSERLIRASSHLPLEPWGMALDSLAKKSESLYPSVKAILLKFGDESSKSDYEALGKSLLGITSISMTESEVVNVAHEFLSVALHPQAQETWIFTIPSLVQLINASFETEAFTEILIEIASRAVSARESLVDWKTGEEKTDAIWKAPIQNLIQACASRLGPEVFLKSFPLHISKDDLSFNPVRVCIINILKEAWRDPPNDTVKLLTFKTIILRLAKFSEDSAAEAESKNLPQTAKMYRTRTIQLWSFLPAFCSGASDVAELLPQLAKIFAQALLDEAVPELCPIIANSFTALVLSCFKSDEFDLEDELLQNRTHAPTEIGDQTTHFNEEEDDDDDEDEDKDAKDNDLKILKGTRFVKQVKPRRFNKPEEVCKQDMSVIQAFVPNFLPVFLNAYDSACRIDFGGSRTTALFKSISALCKVSERTYLSKIFHQLIQKTLIAVKNEDVMTARVLLSISSSFNPYVPDEEVSLIFRTIKPSIIDTESDESLQKRCYVVLINSIKNHPSWVESNREELIEMLQQSLNAVSSSSSKCNRLLCLERLFIISPREELKEFANELLGEVVLAFKETNSQTRNAAFKLFTTLSERMDVNNILPDFFQMTLAGLVAKTPRMRSATLSGISRLVALYGSRPEICTADLLQPCFLLFEEKAREVIKSLITLSKVCIVRLNPEALQVILKPLLKGILPWSLDTKNRFAAKIRVIFDRLIKRIGFEAVEELNVIPKDHKLLIYLRKQMEKRKKKTQKRCKFQQKSSLGIFSQTDIFQLMIMMAINWKKKELKSGNPVPNPLIC